MSHSSLDPIDHVIGPLTARVVLIEYAEFESAASATASAEVKKMLHRWKDRIAFAFRHYPAPDTHPHAELAAEAAEAAGAQHKFWPMHDRLFANREHLKAHALRAYAEDLELDMERYDSEMADHLYLQRIQEHLASGRAAGVRATPTFFINGELIDASDATGHGMRRVVAAVEAQLAR